MARWDELERRAVDVELDADAILRLLVANGVDFVVIGGFAVVAHGYLRTTKDLDVVPLPTAENRDRLERALIEINATPLEQADFKHEEMPVAWGPGALSYGGNWALRTDHGRVDVLQYIDGADIVETYTDLREEALEADVPGVGLVRFASFAHLELMKKVAGRPQDLNDLAQLERIRGEQP